jgi:hypothetical protein
MSTKTVSVAIKGISPLLMHKFPMDKVDESKLTAEEQAERGAFRDPDNGGLFVPGLNLQRALVAAASFSKGKGRASLQKQVAACVMVTPERISLGTERFAIDSRPVVIAATKGRVIRHRPRLDEWGIEFAIEFDPTLLTLADVKKILEDCGSRVGILDFRPEKKGPFGRFMVTRFEVEE